MLPSPYGCRLGPRGYSFSRPQCVHLCYGPVTRSLPWGDSVDRLQSFSFHQLFYPNYGALTSTPAGLSPPQHASLSLDTQPGVPISGTRLSDRLHRKAHDGRPLIAGVGRRHLGTGRSSSSSRAFSEGSEIG